MKFLKTCLKCGENFYSAADHSSHVKTCDGSKPKKKIPKLKKTEKKGEEQKSSETENSEQSSESEEANK